MQIVSVPETGLFAAGLGGWFVALLVMAWRLVWYGGCRIGAPGVYGLRRLVARPT